MDPVPRRDKARDGNVARVWLLTAAMCAAALAMGATGLLPDERLLPHPELHLLLLIPLFAAAEICVIHVYIQRQAHTFSMSEIPLVLGLLFVAPRELLLARVAGSVIALVVHRRQAVAKIAFNLSYFALDTCVVVLVHRAVLGSAAPLEPRGWLAVFAATIAGLVLGALAITLAIAAAEGRFTRAVLEGAAGIGLSTTVMSANLALIAATALASDSRAGILLLVGGAGLFVAYRAHARLRRNHHGLEQIHAFTRTIGSTLDGRAACTKLLHELCTLMHADVAELAFDGDDDAGATVLVVRGGTLQAMAGPEAERVLASRRSMVATTTDPQVVTRGSAWDGVGDAIHDAVLASLELTNGSIGTLLVGNRLSEVEVFDDDDVQLFATLANHASVALRNHNLVERLRLEVREREHQALHDTLTGLPNRALLDSHLREVVERGNGARAAVMIIDLDRFKDVNDTLGHHHGDALLQDVADRIRSVAGPGTFVARLGGDEFAVVVRDWTVCEEVVHLAEAIESRLGDPFEIANLTLDVGASVGIALAPDDGDDAATLLQRADVAMYAAKRGQRSIELYDAEIDQYSPARLALAAELRRTIERRELLVEYQPKADLRTGEIVGVEALARWHHPTHGLIAPETFVGIAERSGLIRALTVQVLEVALRQNRVWRDEGHGLTTAVNLSTRSLLDDSLPATIQQVLADNALPPSALTLEITEGTIISDPARTIGVLNRLSAMGVSLSIDDFGTGYSSLSYLKRLPVDEIKIDRSFVMNMATDDNDAVIVRSTIELGRNLGLRVTAEGVEDAKAWQALSDLGCHQAQGFFLSRPLTSTRLSRWLRDRVTEESTLDALAVKDGEAAVAASG